ncbi:MAG: ATP synthase F0 subunit B [Anaerolineae bacterium]|jgi:F-type H+-transporting ATPase subunit b|nr:MAG: ATP synthase F0 subunit B [Anaerolineae bacterium]
MEKLGINLGFFLFQVFNFTILALLMYALAYKPIVRMLENRKNKIAQGLEDARIAAEARANAEKEAKAILAEAQNNAAQKVREATERADAAAKEIIAQAEAQATKILEEARVEAAQERDRILLELRGQIASLAIAAAQKLIGEALDEKRQHALLEEFFSGVKAGKVVVLENVELSGDSAEVISALPLLPHEQEAVKRDILSKMGEQATVSFRVDPSIMGGLIVKVGDKVLDGSVVGQLESLKQSLQ